MEVPEVCVLFFLLSEVFVFEPLVQQTVVAATELLTSVTQSQDTLRHSEKVFFSNLSLKIVKYILCRIYNGGDDCVIY